jgi:tetratricopeptide (TPR) repeat protein
MTEDATMRAGVDALYGKKDPNTAAVQFRKVLDRNPSPYGATFQLAIALDRAGKPAEALPLWEKVLTMAEGYNDKATADSARAGLETSREAVTMKAGLDALYTRRDPEEAAAQFRKLLERNPSHYGATCQLTRALDQSGKRGEARPWWEKALNMAEASHDKDTAAAARARLAERP